MAHAHAPARRAAALLVLLVGFTLAASAAELTGRASVLGLAAWPGHGDAGREPGQPRPATADQQGLRLMLDQRDAGSECTLHLALSRQNLRGLGDPNGQGGLPPHASDLFRLRPLSGADVSGGADRVTRLAWAVDRAACGWHFGQTSLSLGRQAVDWGSGRLWQALNVFGAFAPTDLDTDHKPGIDALVINGYPSELSSLTLVLAPAPRAAAAAAAARSDAPSAALYLRRRVGQTTQLSLLAGRVIGRPVAGLALEGDWQGLGWRAEALHTGAAAGRGGAWFTVAGVDYSLAGGSHLIAEWTYHGHGATRSSELPWLVQQRDVVYGLQPQLGRHVLGLALQHTLTPLLQARLLLLVGALRDAGGTHALSMQQQISLVYSLSNESDLLLAATLASGPGLAAGLPQSEFGALPGSLTLRWRHYF